jgi:formiminotetrahydrofolate cyclodeaminase
MKKTEAEDFTARIAGPDPCSGGGSVIAYAGALAAALGEMMAELTEGRATFAGQDSRIRKIHQELADARGNLNDLVQKDSAAFQSLLDAMRMPKSSVEEKAVRAEAMERSIQHATETPLWTARAASEVLERLRILIEIGNPNVRCDVAVGAQLAFASIKGAYYNILVNTAGIKNRTFAENCRSEAGNLVKRAQEVLRQVDLLVVGS